MTCGECRTSSLIAPGASNGVAQGDVPAFVRLVSGPFGAQDRPDDPVGEVCLCVAAIRAEPWIAWPAVIMTGPAIWSQVAIDDRTRSDPGDPRPPGWR